MTSTLRVSLLAVLITCAFLFELSGPAAAGYKFKGKPKPFDGAWACSASADHLPLGDGMRSIASLSRIVIDGDSASSEGIAALELSNDSQLVAESTSEGNVTYFDHGIIEIASQLTSGDIDQSTLVRCIGMDQSGGKYKEMRCIDLTDEGEGATQVSLAICKRQ